MFEEQIQMPRMGTSVHESTILSWKKSEGDKVRKGEPILSAESDKIEFEIESTVDGVLKTILKESNSVVPVGSILGIIVTENRPEKPEIDDSNQENLPNSNEQIWAAPVAPLDLESEEIPSTNSIKNLSKKSSKTSYLNFLSPKVRKLIAQHKISDAELSEIVGTGSNGRISSKDILDFVNRSKNVQNSVKYDDLFVSEQNLVNIDFSPIENDRQKKVLPEELSVTRKKIANNLLISSTTIPQVTLFMDIDMSRIFSWRE